MSHNDVTTGDDIEVSLSGGLKISGTVSLVAGDIIEITNNGQRFELVDGRVSHYTQTTMRTLGATVQDVTVN